MIPLPAGVTRINQLKNTGYQLLIATNLGMIIYNPRTFKTEIINVQSPSQPMAEVKNIYTDDFDMVWVFTAVCRPARSYGPHHLRQFLHHPR